MATSAVPSKQLILARASVAGIFMLLCGLVCGCYTNVFGSEYETCSEVDAAMKKELARIQACSVDADCGQILEGTSCGCTNDLVAHKDYETDLFRALQSRAKELKCDTTASDCSCPATNGFVCKSGTCAWNYVP